MNIKRYIICTDRLKAEIRTTACKTLNKNININHSIVFNRLNQFVKKQELMSKDSKSLNPRIPSIVHFLDHDLEDEPFGKITLNWSTPCILFTFKTL